MIAVRQQVCLPFNQFGIPNAEALCSKRIEKRNLPLCFVA